MIFVDPYSLAREFAPTDEGNADVGFMANSNAEIYHARRP